ncbi:hypothetical protein HQ576_00910 [bacterium]|nr:hypothetical protein [bacterium]
MPTEKNANAYRREVASRLAKLAECGPLIDGSLVVIRRRCGNPNCRCARGHKHPAHYLTRKVAGKTVSLYIPVDLVDEVRAWHNEYRRLKRLVAEICERQREVVRRFTTETRRRGRRS